MWKQQTTEASSSPEQTHIPAHILEGKPLHEALRNSPSQTCMYSAPDWMQEPFKTGEALSVSKKLLLIGGRELSL